MLSHWCEALQSWPSSHGSGPGHPTPLRPPLPENEGRHRILDGHRVRRRAVVDGAFTTNTGWKRRRRDYWTTFSRTTGIRFNFTVTPLLNCKTPGRRHAHLAADFTDLLACFGLLQRIDDLLFLPCSRHCPPSVLEANTSASWTQLSRVSFSGFGSISSGPHIIDVQITIRRVLLWKLLQGSTPDSLTDKFPTVYNSPRVRYMQTHSLVCIGVFCFGARA